MSITLETGVANITYANANMTCSVNSVISTALKATQGVSSGKIYFEVTHGAASSNYCGGGIVSAQAPSQSMPGYATEKDLGFIYSGYDGSAYYENGIYTTGHRSVVGDVHGFAIDLTTPDKPIMHHYVNGAFQHTCTPATDTRIAYPVYPCVYLWNAGVTATINLGAASFAYPPPSGYLPFDQAAAMPEAPGGLIAKAASSKVHLSWNAVTAVAGYNVKRSATAGGPYTTIAGNLTGTTYEDTDVTNGTTYYYIVTAVVSGMESRQANEVSATPTAGSGGDTPEQQGYLLTVRMEDDIEREYILTLEQLNAFVDWYTAKVGGTAPAYFMINKSFNRKDCLVAGRIITYEVAGYTN